MELNCEHQVGPVLTLTGGGCMGSTDDAQHSGGTHSLQMKFAAAVDDNEGGNLVS